MANRAIKFAAALGMVSGMALSIAAATPAHAQDARRDFNIRAQLLSSALVEFSRQSDQVVTAPARLTRGKSAVGVQGSYAPRQALQILLRNTGLTVRTNANGSFMLEEGQSRGNVASASADGANGPSYLSPAAQNEATNLQPAADEAADPIVVTGSRVDRKGFQAPTPVTILGAAEIRQGNRANIALLLNDQPAFRGTITPTTTPVNTNSGTSIVDLRGLGSERTLTLLNSRRFIGSADLASVPMGLVQRVEVVTGGASADWGSGAVAGVVNIILNDKLSGLTIAADAGVSSRGDAARYNVNATYGTGFAGGRGHFIAAAGYLRDRGAFGRNDGSRPNLDSALFTSSTGELSLRNNVNLIVTAPGGLVASGPFAGNVFNSDGTLSPIRLGNPSNAAQTVGGSTRGVNDYFAVSSPYERYNAYARASFEVSPAAKFWIDGNFNRVQSQFGFLPENAVLAIQRDNAFLSPQLRAALGAATSFTMVRLLDDIGPSKMFSFAYRRDTLDIGFGMDGDLGGGWSYSGYFDHGRLVDRQTPTNQRIIANFNLAADAVISPTTGQPICRIALTNPSTACRPLNLLGSNNASAAAIAYAFGNARQRLVTQLDAGGVTLRGNPFSTWAGNVSVAVGVEARRQANKTTYIDPLSPTRAFSLDNRTPLNGAFDVKEGFAVAVVPLLNFEGIAVAELNGAARYSDYSNSGGIWSWKTGGTIRLFDDLRLRGVYSRDIRSPGIAELFTTQSITLPTVIDPFRNNASVAVTRYAGGNPDLKPEISHTLSYGGSYSPRFLPGLSFSIDYYSIEIDDVIGTISAQDAVNRCFAGYQRACATIVRDAAGTITTMYGTQVNLASYKTDGIDFDLAYRMPFERIASAVPGSLRLRLLASHVNKLIINDGVNTYDRAGDVGDNAQFTTPKWKATASIGYESDNFSFDTRVRYVGGGKYNHLQPIVNNDVASRTYVDFNVQYDIGNFSIYGAISNAFDRDPPYVTYTSAIYDVIGRYMSGGFKLKF
jgi:outer membrane receptor protein involved in Fe transport